VYSRALIYAGYNARLAAVNDITKIKKAENELRQGKIFLDMVIEHTPMPIFVKEGGDLRYVLVNRAAEKYFGTSRDKIIGKTTGDFYPRAVADKITGQDKESLRAGGSSLSDQSIDTSGQGTRIINQLRNVVYDEEKQPQYLINVIDDVTERRQADDRELQLKLAKLQAEEASSRSESANVAKTEFLASMSHEIRTPLHAIVGYTELLLDEELKGDQRRCAEHIQKASSNLLTILNDVLDLSQIEAGALELEIKAFSLEALIGNTASIVRGAAEKKGLQFRVVFDPTLQNILNGDGPRLGQILLNLLTNAIKFTHKGDITLEVRLETRTDDFENLRFSVADTGIGISKKQRPRLFKRFSQVDNTIQQRFGGTGLGLAISKQLIELMGGKIGVNSEVGRGSTFWIIVSLSRAKNLSVEHFPEVARKAVTPARILVAEDLAINQELTRSILVAAGHQVDIVTNGMEAIAAIQAEPYDLVLMDIQMPVMDGTEATRRIRALDHPANKVPIVAMTANVLSQQIRSFKKAGMSDYIARPMKRNDLLSKLEEWLPRRCAVETISKNKLPEAHPFFNQPVFDDFQNLMGRVPAVTWLTRLGVELDTVFADDRMGTVDRGQLGHSAHDIVSHAGLLGFFELTQCCSELEKACKGGKDLKLLYKNARSASLAAHGMIDILTRRLAN
jgi:PAS domain S-box-containing protein